MKERIHIQQIPLEELTHNFKTQTGTPDLAENVTCKNSNLLNDGRL